MQLLVSDYLYSSQRGGQHNYPMAALIVREAVSAPSVRGAGRRNVASFSQDTNTLQRVADKYTLYKYTGLFRRQFAGCARRNTPTGRRNDILGCGLQEVGGGFCAPAGRASKLGVWPSPRLQPPSFSREIQAQHVPAQT